MEDRAQRLRDRRQSPLSLGGERIVEVWESQEDADRFVAERLAPALEAVGVTGRAQPQIWPVHGYIT